MTWCRGIVSCNMIKTPSCYPRWQQYNTCLAAPSVTRKGHHKIEPKANHFSHGKNNQSSRPNQTDNSKRLAKITQSYIKEFREDSNSIHIPRKHPGAPRNPISTAATFCTQEIPSWGLFRSSVGGGIDHGGLLHEHHSLSDEVWVVYLRPSGP